MSREPALAVLGRELRASAPGAVAWTLAIAPAACLAPTIAPAVLGLAVFASRLGAAAIARDEAARTAELLFVQPVSRTRILAGKVGAVAIVALAAAAVLTAIALGALAATDGPLEPAHLASLFGGAAALSVGSGGAGLLAAACVPEPRAAAPVATAIAIAAWVAAVATGALAAPASPLRGLSPFAADLHTAGASPAAIAALVGFGAACTALAFVRYQRRDVIA